MKMRKVKIEMEKADMMLLDWLITDFLYETDATKAMITKEGVRRLLEIRWAMATKCVESVCPLNEKDFTVLHNQICKHLNINE